MVMKRWRWQYNEILLMNLYHIIIGLLSNPSPSSKIETESKLRLLLLIFVNSWLSCIGIGAKTSGIQYELKISSIRDWLDWKRNTVAIKLRWIRNNPEKWFVAFQGMIDLWYLIRIIDYFDFSNNSVAVWCWD